MTATTTAPASTAISTRHKVRSAVFWAALGVFVIIAALTMGTLRPEADLNYDALNPASPRDNGTQALTALLQERGVEVVIARSASEAKNQLASGGTLALGDPAALSDAGVKSLTADATRVIFLAPSTRLLRLYDLGSNGTLASEPLQQAECDAPEFARTGPISPTRSFLPAADVAGCYPGAEGSFAVLSATRDGQTFTALDARRLFSNGELASNGNAALGLAILGQDTRLIWYVPSVMDTDLAPTEGLTLADHMPGWVTPAIVLLMISAVAVGVARGRRFGPLVAETLPVTVRASETMIGRARMTAQTGDAAHAHGLIRRGTMGRLAQRLGLGAAAAASDVADAVTARLGTDRAAVHALLLGPLAASDAELATQSRQLSDLEHALSQALRQERNTP